VALARATCLYCGATLPAESVGAATETAGVVRARTGAVTRAAGAEAAERHLLILDVQGQTAQGIGRALDLLPFEALMRLRLGGLQLHRAGDQGELRAEARRLEDSGLAVFLIPEAEARAPALLATGGRSEGGGLRLRSDEGSLEIAAADLLLIVRGPIRREYQAREPDRKKPHLASLEDGYRFHLHRRMDSRPVELDPASFAFGAEAPLTGSSLLELRGWLAGLGEGVPVDDGFPRLPPALGTAKAEGDLATRPPSAPLVLDNLAQFRFYSGWRAAIERRRGAGLR